jgi:hypothetical protein
MTVQEALTIIATVIEQMGPVSARTIESHPDVVHACRETKTKARKHIERLVVTRTVQWDQRKQGAVYWV